MGAAGGRGGGRPRGHDSERRSAGRLGSVREAGAPAAGGQVPPLPRPQTADRRPRPEHAGRLHRRRRPRSAGQPGAARREPAAEGRQSRQRLEDAADGQAAARRDRRAGALGGRGRGLAGAERGLERRAALGLPAVASQARRPRRARSLPDRAHRRRRLDARPAGRQADAAAPGELRPHRPAADARRDRTVPGRRQRRGLRARRGPPARLARLRRALGPALARRGPLRRLDRRR